MDEVVASFGDRVGEGVILQQANDRGCQGHRVVVLDEEARDAVLDHLGDSTDVRCDHRTRQRHRLEDRQALRLTP